MRLALPKWVYRIAPLRWLIAVTLWRLLERESGQDTTGAGKAAPDYKYGKVTGLFPDLLVMTQTTESPYVCCGYCSAGMACRVARSGLSKKMQETAHPIRSQGGRPHNNGNNAQELRDGAKRAHDVKLKAIAISEIKENLRAGYAVTVGLQYADLPGYLKVQGGDFGHAVCLYGIEDRDDDDRVGFFDPLYAQDARGAWAKWSDVKAALWSDGNHSTTVVAQKPEPEPEPPKPPKPPKPLPIPPTIEQMGWMPFSILRANWNVDEWDNAQWYLARGAFAWAWVEAVPMWDRAVWAGDWA